MRRIFKICLFFIFFIFLSKPTIGQTNYVLDSLEKEIMQRVMTGDSSLNNRILVNELTRIYESGNAERGIRFISSLMQIYLDRGWLMLYKAMGGPLAVLYKSQGNYQRSLEFAFLFMTLENRDTGKGGNGWGVLELGNIYFHLKDFVRAERYFEEAFIEFQSAVIWPLYLQEGIPEEYQNAAYGAAVALDNIGFCHMEAGKFEEALEFHRKAIFWRKRGGFIEAMAFTYMYMAKTYLKMGNESSYQAYADSSLQIFSQVFFRPKDVFYQMSSWGELLSLRADLHFQNNDLKDAEYLYHFSSRITERIGYNAHLIKNNLQLFEIAKSKGQKFGASGLVFLQKAYEYSQKGKYKPLQLKCLLSLIEYYENEGNYRHALEYSIKMNKLQQSLYVSSERGLVAQTEGFFKIRNQEEKLRIAEELSYRKGQDVKSQRRLIGFLILISILAFLVVLVIMRLLKARQVYNSKLSMTNLQLTQKNLQLVETEKSLTKLNSAKDKFLEILAHDIRSPLAGILGLSGIMEEKSKATNNASLIRMSSGISISVQRLYILVENLLQWVKMQKNSDNLISTQVNVNDLFDNALDTIVALANNKNISVRKDCDPDLTFNGDPVMIESLVRNLLSNAVKFTPEGGKVDLISSIEADDLVIKVKDTGIGLSEEKKKHLANHNDTITTLGTSGEKGSGLGLLLCHEYVKLHSGAISVESEPGKGTTFIVQLPFKNAVGYISDNRVVE